MIPRARREALDWDDRLKRDRSPATRAAFEAWLAADPANRHEFAQLDVLDDLLGRAGVRSRWPEPKPGVRLWPALATAAAVGAIVTVAVIGLPLSPGGPLVSAAQAQLTRPLRLSDGTLVILSKTARAEPRFTPSERRVALRGGAARFIVATDPRGSLVVETPALRARAAGGVFEVDALSPAGSVTALAGTVTVERLSADAGQPASMPVAPGQQLDAATLTTAPAPREERVTVIEIDALPLGDVVRIANTGSGVPLVIADGAIGGRRVTGRFDVTDHRILARRLAVALGLRVDDRGDHLLLAP